MKMWMIAAALLFGAASAGAQAKVEKGMKLEKTASFRIYSLAGTVRIIGWNRDSLHVRGSIARGDEFHMGGSPSGAKMFVENADERNPGEAVIEVFAPVRSRIWVKTATGSVTVSDFLGGLDIYTVSGAINVTGSPDDMNAEAIDGNIRISGSPRFVRAKSASGRVEFNGNCDDATLSTVSGGVTVERGVFERARFESVTGPIRFAGAISSGGSAVFDTHSGITDIAMAKNADVDISLVTIAGKISNALTSSRPIPGRYGRGGELTTTSGDGGAQLVAKSFKGNITLKTVK